MNLKNKCIYNYMFYCVHCRAQTESKNIETKSTKNGKRTYTSATCVQCGKIKTTFKRFQDGGSNDVIKLDGENHVHGNFCGPNTDNKKRIELMKQGKSLPIDDIDKACFKHDMNYVKLRRKKKSGISDEDLKNLTRKVDDVFIDDVAKSRANAFDKKMIVTAIKGKKMVEDIGNKPLFVGNDQSRDPTPEQYPETELNLKGGRNKKVKVKKIVGGSIIRVPKNKI